MPPGCAQLALPNACSRNLAVTGFTVSLRRMQCSLVIEGSLCPSSSEASYSPRSR